MFCMTNLSCYEVATWHVNWARDLSNTIHMSTTDVKLCN